MSRFTRWKSRSKSQNRSFIMRFFIKPKYVYLLHFDEPISPDHTCQHYLGSTHDITVAIQAHRAGRRERCVLTHVAKQREIGFVVSRVWLGGLKLEKRLKRWKNGPALCPICSTRPARVLGVKELSKREIKEALLPF